ncbi:MAG: hypothetical protein HYU36_05275 [Planctomycetes bacterium]|nr:hypothetical protein [Planctomycetota bacterium]
MNGSFENHHESHQEWSALSLAFVMGALVSTSALIVLITAPFTKILGPSAFALGAALHGLTAFVLLVVATVSLYLAWRLYMGRIQAFPDLQLATTVMATLAFITITFGNWIYIPYRAKIPDSPRSYFLTNMPEVHQVFFEFKEFTALFTLPLATAAAFILWRYGRQILADRHARTRTAIAILIALHFFYFVIAFGLGAAVTKLKAI